MRIGGLYSFNGGKEAVTAQYLGELDEIYQTISAIDADQHKERTAHGKLLYQQNELSKAFKRQFKEFSWNVNVEIYCDYSTEYYLPNYVPPLESRRTYRKMDFLKNKLGVEVHFKKYASAVYDLCAEMTIFRNEGFIDAGVEIVPLKGFAREMSTGVSYFEQFVWDLERRGVADIDIPVLILGITP